MPYLSPPTLTIDEQKLILRTTAKHPRDHLIISMALGTGLRLAELRVKRRRSLPAGRKQSELFSLPTNGAERERSPSRQRDGAIPSGRGSRSRFLPSASGTGSIDSM
jgi:hypothetical protein